MQLVLLVAMLHEVITHGLVDLAKIFPGESFMVTMAAFWKTPLAAMPKQCEITIGAEKFGSEPAEITKLCVFGDQASKGACPKKAKQSNEVEVDTPVEIGF